MMQTHRAFAIALTVACAGFLSAFAAAATASSPAPEAAGSQDPHLGVQDSWIYVIDEPRVYLDRAYGELRRRKRTEAASNVRRAAALIDIEATRAKGADRIRLKRDASGLLQLAAEIEAGRLGDGRRLHFALAIARADLAIHHDMNAAEAWIRHDRLTAARSLAAAGRYVNGALIGLDAKVPAPLSEALQQAESLGERLGSRAEGATESAWTQARDALHRALRFMEEKLESRGTTPG
jgi:hypothetical protein